MIIANFTKPELEVLRNNCNFVGYEMDIFNLRSQGVPLEAIAESMNLSMDGAKRISQKVNSKISRVISHF